MRQDFVTAITVSAALLLAGGCVAAGLSSDDRRDAAPQSATEPLGPLPHSDREPASATPQPLRDGEPKDKKRGNTPPGMDRSGGGPASGAILDPAGAVTKEPVLRER